MHDAAHRIGAHLRFEHERVRYQHGKYESDRLIGLVRAGGWVDLAESRGEFRRNIPRRLKRASARSEGERRRVRQRKDREACSHGQNPGRRRRVAQWGSRVRGQAKGWGG